MFFTITIALLGLIVGTTIYLRRPHSTLSTKFQHHSSHGPLDPSHKSSIHSLSIESVQDGCTCVFDTASKTISSSRLPSADRDELITTFLRHTMVLFSNLPQAWILWLVASSRIKKSFEKNVIKVSRFGVGDIICGYEIILREPGRVEFKMEVEGMKDVKGRLVFSGEGKEEGMVFTTSTAMWKSRKMKGKMPLEQGLVFWIHELTSWWLLERGVGFLASSGKARDEKEL